MNDAQQKSRLPPGWTRTTLGEVVEVLDHLRIPLNSRERALRKGPIPYYGATGRVDWIDDFLFEEELILLGEDGAPFLDPSKPKAYLVEGKSWVNNHAHVLRGHSGISNKFLVYQLNQLDFAPYLSGTTRLKLPQSQMRSIPIVVAPWAEQLRVVEEIEKQFLRIDLGVEALHQLERNLIRLSASILEEAMEGRLVPSESTLAKIEGRGYERADLLLRRILQERRDRWESEQITKMQLQDKPSNDDRWKAKYPEPRLPDIGNLPQLPDGWTWTNADSVFFFITSGSRGWAQFYSNEGALFLRVGNLKHNSIDLDLTITQRVDLPDEVEGTRTKLRDGDILISITADVGMVAYVPENLEPAYINQHVALARPVDAVDKRFLAWYLASEKGQQQFSEMQRGATKMGLGLEELRSVLIALPPFAEQYRITAELERRLSTFSKLEGYFKSSLKRADLLRQKILQRAFEGRLVYQDSGDEPARLLVENIRAQKAARDAETKQTDLERRTRMTGTRPKSKTRKLRRPLREVVAESKAQLTPERLFLEAGFSPELVEEFYEELRKAVMDHTIEQIRPNETDVYLIAIE